MYPPDLKYTTEHEWARLTSGTVRIGITGYAQEALGDIVFVSLPDVGQRFAAGEPFGEVESTKSVSDVYAPLEGEVVARNETLSSNPELVNSDPYGDGWLLEIAPAAPADYGTLLSAEEYAKHVESSGAGSA
jgi:glycine cleavage system H protein